MKGRTIVGLAGIALVLTACGQTAVDDADTAEAVREITDEATPTADGAEAWDDSDKVTGEDLYYAPLRVLRTAISAGADAETYVDNGFSPEYYTIMQENGDDGRSKIGYAVKDINRDGIEELFIGDIATRAIYDIYTIVDGEPEHVVSGTKNDSYCVQSDVWICNEFSHNYEESGWTFYGLASNSADLLYQWGYKYDSIENADNPWFTTDSNDQWVPISQSEFNEDLRFKTENCTTPELKPLGE